MAHQFPSQPTIKPISQYNSATGIGGSHIENTYKNMPEINKKLFVCYCNMDGKSASKASVLLNNLKNQFRKFEAKYDIIVLPVYNQKTEIVILDGETKDINPVQNLDDLT